MNTFGKNTGIKQQSAVGEDDISVMLSLLPDGGRYKLSLQG